MNVGDERGRTRRKACGRGMKGNREKEREREREREGQAKRERDETSSARKGSRAFTQGWVQLQTQHSHPPPFYRVVKCPSLLALALCPFSFLFVPASPPAVRFAPLHPLQRADRRVEYVRLRCAPALFRFVAWHTHKNVLRFFPFFFITALVYHFTLLVLFSVRNSDCLCRFF